MKVFCAGLNILEVAMIDSTHWNINAEVVDNSGIFSPFDVQVSDVMYTTGVSPNTYQSYICRYQITAIDTTQTNVSNLHATVVWGEDDLTDICDPQPSYDSIIGKLVSPEFPCSYISSQSNNVSENFIQMARNIDIDYGIKHRTANVAGISRKDVFIVADSNVKEYSLTHTDVLETDAITMNGLELSNDVDDDYIIESGKIKFNNNIQLTATDVIVAKYKSLT